MKNTSRKERRAATKQRRLELVMKWTAIWQNTTNNKKMAVQDRLKLIAIDVKARQAKEPFLKSELRSTFFGWVRTIAKHEEDVSALLEA